MVDPGVKNYSKQLDKLGIEHSFVEHPYLVKVEDIYKYFGLDLDAGLSTLIMNTGEGYAAVIRRDDCKLDFNKLRKELGVEEAEMATKKEFTELTGLEPGAAHVYYPEVETLLDTKLFEKEYLLGGCGSFVLSGRYKAEDLKKLPNSRVVDVTIAPEKDVVIKGLGEKKVVQKRKAKRMDKPRVFSGIQPSGELHIGNYIGAIKQWVARQDERENVFCIVDLHAITVPQDPKVLKRKIRELAALYIACGIDPKKSIMFVQSHNPDHAQMGWILNCFTGIGELSRMTQYKDKSGKQEFVSAGLYDYPVLQAADILLYNTNEVPIGEDQKQHVELTRDIAQRFNSRYGQEVLVLPEPVLGQLGARIMSLQDPMAKMSKSDMNDISKINMLDDLDKVRKKVRRAVTDSGTEIRVGDDKPAMSNLLQIYTELAGIKVDELEKKYRGVGYGEFKGELAEVVVEALRPIQERFKEVMSSGVIDMILEDGAERARKVSAKKLAEVEKVVGLG
jgi:tryptophanyl-tRNA synthetase